MFFGIVLDERRSVIGVLLKFCISGEMSFYDVEKTLFIDNHEFR